MVFKDRDKYVSGEYRYRHGYCRSNPRKMVKVLGVDLLQFILGLCVDVWRNSIDKRIRTKFQEIVRLQGLETLIL